MWKQDWFFYNNDPLHVGMHAAIEEIRAYEVPAIYAMTSKEKVKKYIFAK